VSGFDPAAAPLATDAETAGASPVAAAEPPLPGGARADPSGWAADPSGSTDRSRYRMQDRLAWPAAIGLVLIALAIILAILLIV
jgi:hypothetical protein